eukprot:361861-Rhodomonas_salina.1
MPRCLIFGKDPQIARVLEAAGTLPLHAHRLGVGVADLVSVLSGDRMSCVCSHQTPRAPNALFLDRGSVQDKGVCAC